MTKFLSLIVLVAITLMLGGCQGGRVSLGICEFRYSDVQPVAWSTYQSPNGCVDHTNTDPRYAQENMEKRHGRKNVHYVGTNQKGEAVFVGHRGPY